MSLDLAPWTDLAGYAVLSRLDAADLTEAAIVRGAGTSPLQLFAEWRAMEPHRIVSLVASRRPCDGGGAFAVFGLAQTGQAGVAAAAMLACDHARHARPLARLVTLLAREMPVFAAARGIRRIEARCWSAHPTAPRLLSSIGFWPECAMPGFGPDGRAVFTQFAWVPDWCPTAAPAPAAASAPVNAKE